MNLSEKSAIVTGVSSGLGKELANALVRKGCKVYGLARNGHNLAKIKFQLGKLFIPVVLDITDFKKVENWIHSEFSSSNSPDILINNAGVGRFGKIDEMPFEDWLTMVNTNLNGMYFLTAQVVPFLKQKETSTSILNIGSILGTVGRAEGSAYSATKFGVQGFSDSLFKELREFNIKVSCIHPGSIDTHFFQSSGIKSHPYMLNPQEVSDIIIHVLETPDNLLISELTIRPLHPKPPMGK